MAREKAKPIEERIASLMGKTAYFDIREGTGGTNPLRILDQDVAAALGLVSIRQGKLAALVLETHYGQTLCHKATLLRAWEDGERHPGDTRERVVLTRFGGELAIRELAGIKYGTPALTEYAYLIFSRREALQQRLKEAGSWLEQHRTSALAELKAVLRDPDFQDERRERRERAA